MIKFSSNLGWAAEQRRQRCNFPEDKSCSATRPRVQLGITAGTPHQPGRTRSGEQSVTIAVTLREGTCRRRF